MAKSQYDSDDLKLSVLDTAELSVGVQGKLFETSIHVKRVANHYQGTNMGGYNQFGLSSWSTGHFFAFWRYNLQDLTGKYCLNHSWISTENKHKVTALTSFLHLQDGLTWHFSLMQKWLFPRQFVPSGKNHPLDTDPPPDPALKHWIWHEEVFCASPKGKMLASSRLACLHIFSTLVLRSSEQTSLPAEHNLYFSPTPLQNLPPFWGLGLLHFLLDCLSPWMLDPDWHEQEPNADQDDHCPWTLFCTTIAAACLSKMFISGLGDFGFRVHTPRRHH